VDKLARYQRQHDWRGCTTISVEEAAPILGVGRSSAYKAAATGELPTIRVGKKLRVPVIRLRRMLGEEPTT
jgi:excisionase family DNA binding protein